MAKGCIYYQVQICSGGPWVDASRPLRATMPIMDTIYDDICAKTPDHVSVRLVEAKVLKQRNGKSP